MSRKGLAVLILALGMAISASLRITGVVGKKTLTFDEAISYLSATGHQGEYSRVDEDGLIGSWVPASEWKKFMKVEELFCFKRIGFDIARHDIHPPLYFWLLHLWTVLFGVHLWTGPLLNILISLISIPLLFFLANRILRNPIDAATVAFIWALSSSVMQISCVARHYDLLAFCTILLVLQNLRIADITRKPRFWEFMVLAISTAAGVLTHYSFLIVVTGCGLFLIVKLAGKKNRQLAVGLISMGVGLLLFFLLHPDFYLSIRSHSAQVQEFRFDEIPSRIKVVLYAFGTFFWHGKPLIFTLSPAFLYKYLYSPLSLALVIGLAVLYFRARKSAARDFNRTEFPEYHIIYFLVWTAGLTVFFYIAFLYHKYAMGPRYLTMSWPFFAFLPVLILRRFGRFKIGLTVCLLLAQVFFGSMDMLYFNYVDRGKPDSNVLLSESGTILVDHVARGILLPILWHIPDDKLVFIADQAYLLGHRETWLKGLRGGSVYISELYYGNSEQQRQEILNLISQQYRIIPITDYVIGAGKMFRIEEMVNFGYSLPPASIPRLP